MPLNCRRGQLHCVGIGVGVVVGAGVAAGVAVDVGVAGQAPVPAPLAVWHCGVCRWAASFGTTSSSDARRRSEGSPYLNKETMIGH